MQVLHINLNQPIPYIDNLSVCLGYFNGLHIGHLALINKTKSFEGKHAIMTFHPHPTSFFSKRKTAVLTDIDDQIEILEKLNLDYFIIFNFSLEAVHLNKDAFIERILVPLGTKHVIAGFDYHFGYKAEGNMEYLKNNCKDNFEVHEVDEIIFQNEKASSTQVISFLMDGKIELANTLLSRPYRVKGKVVKGKHNGHRLGFPTANVDLIDNYVLPKNGVYAVKVEVDNQIYFGMGNIGIHPTIDELQNRLLEVHLFDFNGDLYQKDIKVYFYQHIRDEMKFDTIELLIAQLNKDQRKTKTYFKQIKTLVKED